MNEGSTLEKIVNEVLPYVSGKRILDVGTGFGTVVSKLLGLDKTEVVSIDPEKWSFDEIERIYRSEIEDGRLQLKNARAEDIPFDRMSFSTSISICSLHHLPDPVIGIREMERVTSDRIIITDWNPSTGGKGNPHSPEHLQASKQKILDYANSNNYSVEEHGDWFLAVK